MTDHEQKVCDSIHHFILFKLSENLDDNVFKKTSIEELGRYLFNIILCNINDSTEELIQIVIKTICDPDNDIHQ